MPNATEGGDARRDTSGRSRVFKDGLGSRLWLLAGCWDVEIQRFGKVLAPAVNKAGQGSALNKWINPQIGNARDRDLEKALESIASEVLKAEIESRNESAESFKKALLSDNQGDFFAFLARASAGSVGRQNKANSVEVADEISADSIGDQQSLGSATAPLTSSNYVGVKWPDLDSLKQHCDSAYVELFGHSRPDKQKRTEQKAVFFFYRLGFEDFDNFETIDCAIRARDTKLKLVIRRVPALITYSAPFDNWFKYEEEYKNSYSDKPDVPLKAEAAIYGFNGGMTLLSRDSAEAGTGGSRLAKLSLVHFDFRPMVGPRQKGDGFYPGIIAMESDFNPRRKDYFAPTAYRCILRRAPDGYEWETARSEGSKTVMLGDASAILNGQYDFGHGKDWGREELDFRPPNERRGTKKKGDKKKDALESAASCDALPVEGASWRWYFNRLNINRHVADLLVACPSRYDRWPNGAGS